MLWLKIAFIIDASDIFASIIQLEVLKMVSKEVFQKHPDALVISLGGSMLFRQGTTKVDEEYAGKFASLVQGFASKGKKLIVIIGGGMRAKKAAGKARSLTRSEFFADREAIKATRKNAKVLQKLLGEQAFKKLIKSPDDAALALESGKIGVGGGFLEGLTTDACSVLCAERVGASTVFNVSNVQGVYDSDPKTNPAAKKFSEMTHSQLVELAAVSDSRAAKGGGAFVFDLIACKLSARSNITVHFVNGKDLQQVERALSGQSHQGTVVRA